MSILENLPSLDEERAILARARESSNGMAQLLETYKVLVYINAHKWKRKHRVNDIWKDDLYQEGYIGLMRAVNTYNDSYGTKFTTWAICCIEGAIRNIISKNKHHKNAISLSSMLNKEMEVEGLFASEYDHNNSLSDESIKIDLCKIVSNRELDLIRIKYNLEI